MALVCLTASATVSKTATPAWFEGTRAAAFARSNAGDDVGAVLDRFWWKVPVLPVMPCTSRRVFCRESIAMARSSPYSGLRATGRRSLRPIGHVGCRHHVETESRKIGLVIDVGAFEPEPPAAPEPDFLTAAMTPLAMVSHFMMPPKMLMKMPRTDGSEVMILNAAVTFLLSRAAANIRKLAGMPPQCWMMSMVAIARPAVYHAADGAGQLDVRQVEAFGLGLRWIFLIQVAQRLQLRVAATGRCRRC